MNNALDGSLEWREVCFSIPWIWFVYMVCFFIRKKYDVHAYKHLSLKLDLIEHLWALKGTNFYWNKRCLGYMFLYFISVF
jgi:hypothetical protein